MSLVSTWCKCSDGRWYKNPVWASSRRNYTWFVCLDDKEPPELVMLHGMETAIMDSGVIDWFKPGKNFTRGVMRCFDTSVGSGMRPAVSVFGRIVAAPPIPTHFDDISRDPPAWGALYE